MNNDIIIPKTPGSREESITGKYITSSCAMEPGEAYGDGCRDSYCVEVTANDHRVDALFFSDVAEIEEFIGHLTEFVRKFKK